ncbi:MAG: 1-deoxy-D-xylulose-5-phosphate synthase [Chromatiales bacterium]|jgi:1-deoxy-D-xylulose-5-phosphate synthase
MIDSSTYPLLSTIDSPEDLRRLPADQIGAVAEELRRYLIETVSTMGGHFAAGLGTVELTIALHYIFDTPDDRLIWDVGHQAYPHKVITGRRDQLHTIKRKDGLAPFPKRGESPFDVFGVGHSSTSVSAGLGMAIAAALQNQTRKVVAVIGDGALTGGMAFEALNHAGSLNVDMLVVLNDNDMSISENVGAMSNYLAKMLSGKLYSHIREGSKKVLRTMPTVWELARRSEEHVKGMVLPGTLFEEMGLNYIGPIDGHDLDTLVKTLENLKNLKGPQFLHVVTRKGKGYAPAERDPIKWHGPGPFDPATGTFRAKAAAGLTYSQVFGQWLCDIAAQDERVVVITPAMREGSGLVQYSRDFPDRYFDVAIAEQHAVTLGAGFACEGMRPVVAIYSTFLQRGYDQLIHDVALQNLPVLFAIDRAGLVGGDGATHQGSYDICFMRCLPNMTIMTPADEDECRQMLFTGLQLEGPAAVRYPRGSGPGVVPEQEMRALPVGKAQLRRKGNGIALLAFGAMVGAAESIGARLDASVVNMRFVKPLDVDMVMRMADTHDALVTIEDGVVAGGAGGAIIECLAEQGKLIPVLNIGIGDRIIEHGSRGDNLADAGLDEESLYRTIDNWRPSVPAAAPGGIV